MFAGQFQVSGRIELHRLWTAMARSDRRTGAMLPEGAAQGASSLLGLIVSR
ncbi:hypothetical protein [Mastigocladopsis repens]|uniref:hypothetical protein n=1 Tax=Mastigocladopsis repens TaxID=221287 RepID=UPI0003059F7B|nr:hypothetical protein [Mastigocladopsis repens]